MFKRLWATASAVLVAVQLALGGHLAVARYNLVAETRDVATGAIVARQEVHNLVTAAGLDLIRDYMNSGGAAGITHFAVGTGTTPATAGDTALGAEVTRQVVTSKTPGVASLVVRYYLGSTTANGSTLTEVGLFDAAVAGTLYCRALLAGSIVKTAAISVTFIWTLTWAAA